MNDDLAHDDLAHAARDSGEFRSTAEFEAGWHTILAAPRDQGTLELIARRPRVDAREILAEATLDLEHGLKGDDWRRRARPQETPGDAWRDTQLTLMCARVAKLVAGPVERWSLAGDQLYVDFDLGVDNLPAGARVTVGEALLEITAEPHLGCAKFARRFGRDALRFVNSPAGRRHRLRGVYAKVLRGGTARPGDKVFKT